MAQSFLSKSYNNEIHCFNQLILGDKNDKDNTDEINIRAVNERPIRLGGRLYPHEGQQGIIEDDWIDISTVATFSSPYNSTVEGDQVAQVLKTRIGNYELVKFRGLITHSGAGTGAWSSDEVIFTLPVDYEPPSQLYFVNYGETTGSTFFGGARVSGKDASTGDPGDFIKQFPGTQFGLDNIFYFIDYED